MPGSDVRCGFTLIELMIVVAVLGVLVSVGVHEYQTVVLKAHEASTRGNLATLRSALSIYYGDNYELYPLDNLTSLASDTKYLAFIPLVKTPPHHGDSSAVTPETTASDTGQWSYDNVQTDANWGHIEVGCLHADSRTQVWTSY
jgi:general secretion pathway protein G